MGPCRRSNPLGARPCLQSRRRRDTRNQSAPRRREAGAHRPWPRAWTCWNPPGWKSTGSTGWSQRKSGNARPERFSLIWELEPVADQEKGRPEVRVRERVARDQLALGALQRLRSRHAGLVQLGVEVDEQAIGGL